MDVLPNPELERAVRIRVIHDVRRPLKSTVKVRMSEGRSAATEFKVKFERLPTFCYGCGVLGHGEKECEDGPYEEGELKYGEWLRASPWRVTKTSTEPSHMLLAKEGASIVLGENGEGNMENMDKQARAGGVEEDAGIAGATSDNAGQDETVGGGGIYDMVCEERVIPLTVSDGGCVGKEKGAGAEGRKWKKFAREKGSVNSGGSDSTIADRAGSKRGREGVEEGLESAAKKPFIDMVGGLRNLIRREAPTFVFLSETKLSSVEMRKISSSFDEFYSMEVDSVGRSGGLAFMWRKDLKVVFRAASVHFMDFDIEMDSLKWRLTGFYGWPSVQDRHLSWQLLRTLASESQDPWLCVGDFNEILFADEMKGGTRAQWQMNNFREAVDDCGLSDLAYVGYAFTFDNGQGGEENRQCRLDRAMKTESWREIFPYAKLFHMDREWSEHAPLKVVLNGRSEEERPHNSRFRFEQIWIGEEGCEDTIKRVWEEEDWNVLETISRCARELQKWKGISIGKILRELKRKRKRLTWLNESDRTACNVEERKKIMKEINHLLRQEETFWRQRSRALWLKDGDRNTKYFHRKAGQRKQKNKISRIVEEDGTTREGSEAIKAASVRYFSSLFTSSKPTDFEELLVGVQGRVTTGMNETFSAAYRGDEVLEALNQMHPLKAPGPDGMNALFYQTYWHIVGPSVTRMVLGILNGGPRQSIKLFWGQLVSENQSAFTRETYLDNLLIAFEMFHYMKNSRGGGGHMALKLDMEKAYDRVEWLFLRRVLEVMGFDANWVSRVMQCVQSVSYEVLINGSPSASFVPERGLRQGDPISPYLFILCAEVLSSMLRRKVELGSLQGIRIAPQAPIISHLFFADDSIIFVKADENQARVVLNILAQYEVASGQLVSKEKTTVCFSKGTTTRRKERVAAVLGVKVVNEHDKYLGLPTVIGHSKQLLSKVIRDKLNNKMQGWRGMLFSRAGKEILIKAVAQSIPTYAMSVFKLPSNFCDELRSIVSRFWWGSNNGKRRIPWVAWSHMCRAKANGGMGFRDFAKFNLALLAKQAWRLVNEDGSLMARILKAKYFPSCSFMEANLGVSPSYTWRSICESKIVMRLGLRKSIGGGENTSVWLDPWIPGTETRRVISPRREADVNMKVGELMVQGERRWDRGMIESLFLPFEAERILQVRLSEEVREDDWCWEHEKDGVYSVRSGYRLLAGSSSGEGEQSDSMAARWIWKAIWKIPVLPRIKAFMWQLCNEALPTRANIAARMGQVDTACPRCQSNVETCLHVVRDCGWGDGIWEGMGIEVDRTVGFVRVREWMEGMLRILDARERVVFVTTCWVLWEKRNKLIFEEARWEQESILRRVRDLVGEMESLQEVEETYGGGNGRVGELEGGWGRPCVGTWKVNVDAGVMEGVGVGIGVVCRDHEGGMEWAVSVQRDGSCGVPMAEAEAILLGLKEAWIRGQRSIVIESDCLEVVQALRKKKRGRSELFIIYEDILLFCNRFLHFFTHSRRNFNRLAHEVAHARPWSIGRRVWMDEFPLQFVDVASHDLLNMI
ncbi:uncharacterized protein LOC141588759 [Silene latifolia]|uniref:uncharacterized protein LOC141588759 n=1 Tax=Silene latifolia TaxID=37657 RepID=UPI003D78559F